MFDTPGLGELQAVVFKGQPRLNGDVVAGVVSTGIDQGLFVAVHYVIGHLQAGGGQLVGDDQLKVEGVLGQRLSLALLTKSRNSPRGML